MEAASRASASRVKAARYHDAVMQSRNTYENRYAITANFPHDFKSMVIPNGQQQNQKYKQKLEKRGRFAINARRQRNIADSD
jgi:hypothetical protein